MKDLHVLSGIKNFMQRNNLSYEAFLPALGLIPLAYVFYAGFIDLPPILNTLTVFVSIFIGLSAILYWREKYFVVPLFLIFMSLFFLPLTWLWRGLEFDVMTLMGVFPFNDGMYYLMDAYRLLWGLDTMIAPNGRPLFSGLLTFLMWVFDGNVQIALALICAAAAFSVFLLALEIREKAGPIAAGTASTILFFFYLTYMGRINTENLGVLLGVLAFALLLKGARKGSLTTLAIGAFILSLALNARAGAFFTLPFIVLWSWVNRKTFGWKAPFLLMIAISLGFIINMYLIKTVGTKTEDTFSNYGHSLYGLAAGYKGWAYIYTIHPEFSNDSNVLPLALELIQQNPSLLLKGILLNYMDYFTPKEMFLLMYFRDQQTAVSWVLYLMTIVGFYRLLKLRNEMYWSLVLYLLAGIFLSVALIPVNDGGVRTLMSTHPVNALLAGLAFLPFKNRQPEESANIRTSLPEIYAVILAVVCTFGPVVVLNFPFTFDPLPVLNCPEGTEQISVRITPGSYVSVVKNGSRFAFLPEIRKEDINTRLDDYHYDGNLPYILVEFPSFERLVKRLRPGDTILIGINLVELNIGDGPDEFVFLITRTDQIQKIGEINHFCARLSTAERLDTNRFYYEMTMRPMEWESK